VTIVGTGHVFRKSVDLVKTQVNAVKPDLIAVELDLNRFIGLQRRRRVTLRNITSADNKQAFIVQLLLQSLQQKAARATGSRAGREFLVAIEEASRRRIPVALVDQDVRLTMTRALKFLTLGEKLKLAQGIVTGLLGFGRADLDKVMSEKEELMKEFKTELPTIYRVFVTERDKYMASAVADQPFTNILLVVGAGHVPGIASELQKIAELQK
jgi:pheromone shutdown-related protein TraB